MLIHLLISMNLLITLTNKYMTKKEIINTLDKIIANYYNYEKNLFSPLQLKELAEACKKIIEKE